MFFCRNDCLQKGNHEMSFETAPAFLTYIQTEPPNRTSIVPYRTFRQESMTSISPEQEEILSITESVLSYALTELERPRKVRFALADLMSLRDEPGHLQALATSRKRVGTGI